MKKCLPALLSACLFSLGTASAYAEECLKMASPPASFGVAAGYKPDVTKVFKTAGFCVEHVHMPAKRIQKLMAEGKLDGEFIRVKQYIQAMKGQVVHLPTPIASAKGVLVTMKSSGFAPKTIQEAADKKIGIVHGVQWHQAFARFLKKPQKGKKYNNLGKQMAAGRIDGFLIEEGTINQLVTSGVLKKEDIHISPPIIDLSAFILMHKKNEAIVSKLDTALQKVLADGGFNTNR